MVVGDVLQMGRCIYIWAIKGKVGVASSVALNIGPLREDQRRHCKGDDEALERLAGNDEAYGVEPSGKCVDSSVCGGASLVP